MKNLLSELFGIEDATITKLYGYDNLNYKVSLQGKTYILKLYNKTSEKVEILKAENEILTFLQKQKNEVYPEIVPNKRGDYISEYSLNNKLMSVRLLSFLKGNLFVDEPKTNHLFSSFGTFLAKFTQRATSFENQTYINFKTDWDISNLLDSRKLTVHIKNKENRVLTEYFFNEFEINAHFKLHELRQSIIHNDANDRNILTKNNSVIGLFDFGDVCYSATINEVAVALSYTLLETKNPLELVLHFIKAFHEVYPLQKEEIDLLYYLIPARMCISVCHSSYNQTLDPENEYISVSQKPAFKMLKYWRTLSPAILAENIWNELK